MHVATSYSYDNIRSAGLCPSSPKCLPLVKDYLRRGAIKGKAPVGDQNSGRCNIASGLARPFDWP